MQNQGFSPFSWALGLFCLPSALWPLALFISAKFSSSPNLSPRQIDFFSIAFWIYPLVLLAVSGLLYKLYQRKPTLAKGLLVCGFILFYGLFIYIVRSV